MKRRSRKTRKMTKAQQEMLSQWYGNSVGNSVLTDYATGNVKTVVVTIPKK